MRIRPLGLIVGLGLVTSGVIMAAEPAASWSDGVAGSSGAVPAHLRECTPPFKYCKVRTSGCGGCHGDWEAMMAQRQSEQPVIDRISAEIWVNGRRDTWEYTPGSEYVLDIYIYTSRERGEYNHAAFDLNTSAGKFSLFPGDKTLRITGGDYQHAGSKNPQAKVCNPQNPTDCRPYGATLDDERNWSGELTNTAYGSNASSIQTTTGYHWRAKWTAPARQEPRGVGMVMSYMVPNGDGIDNCVYVIDNTGCNSTKGYSDQDLWDWWSRFISNGYGAYRILCEKGQRQADCYKRVLDYIVPPAPPLNTNGTDGPDDTGEDGFGSSPTLPGEAWAGLFVAGLVAYRRFRRPNA